MEHTGYLMSVIVPSGAAAERLIPIEWVLIFFRLDFCGYISYNVFKRTIIANGIYERLLFLTTVLW